ncbi:hypothetical protein FNF29_02753 [Cafeteria roenbergensis]|uniref:RNA-polymerase II-associated protein 3-like C-terminal domain-containing protein n=1 Tax=Cafeteria roenbergensis TaxID=33653 RepID=A0A5A8CLX8_CAFRO|nr:hypothetical protein FNF29_02753 [Cafeteria roenbergensis]|eukprot:KAA0154133.1 hypothetical protein FNF29_02753 [Cafeteria roenbergensis]
MAQSFDEGRASAQLASSMLGATDLESDRKIEVDISWLDFDYVARCSDPDRLHAMLDVLKSGSQGRYPELERATEDRLVAVLPADKRALYLARTRGASAAEVAGAKAELEDWRRRLLQSLKLPESLDPAAMSDAERRAAAENERNKGNESFRVGEAEAAALSYGRAMAFLGFGPGMASLAAAAGPASGSPAGAGAGAGVGVGHAVAELAATVASNRAQANLQLKRFAAAEQDADSAVAVFQAAEEDSDDEDDGGAAEAAASGGTGPKPGAGAGGGAIALAIEEEDEDEDEADATAAAAATTDGAAHGSSGGAIALAIHEEDEDDDDDQKQGVTEPAAAATAAASVAPRTVPAQASTAPAPLAPAAKQTPPVYDVPALRRLVAESLKSAGNSAWASGDKATAEQRFRDSARADPHFLPARANLANALLSLGRPAAAALHAKAASALVGFRSADDAAALDSDGSAAHPHGLPLTSGAGSLCRPLVVKCLYREGLALLRVGRPDEALGVLQTVLAIDQGQTKAREAYNEALMAVAGGEVDVDAKVLPAGEQIEEMGLEELRAAAAAAGLASEGEPAQAQPQAAAPVAKAAAAAGGALEAAAADEAPSAALARRAEEAGHAAAAPPAPAAAASAASAGGPSAPSLASAAPAAAAAKPSTPAKAPRFVAAAGGLSPEKAREAVELASRAVAASRLPPPPADGAELERGLDLLQRRADDGTGSWADVAAFLESVDATALKGMFRRRELELAALETALHGLAVAAPSRPKVAIRILRDLAGARGFAMLTSLLGEDDLARARTVLNAAVDAAVLPKACVKVRKAFALA